mmetsp:Transcript_47988/g.97698  ORF Transcript_47988/g.97698 Transcript_47988/m.97698 type:complete len:208 (-) Transcript_47988:256-879(-)
MFAQQLSEVLQVVPVMLQHPGFADAIFDAKVMVAAMQHQHIELLNLFNQVVDHRAIRQIAQAATFGFPQMLQRHRHRSSAAEPHHAACFGRLGLAESVTKLAAPKADHSLLLRAVAFTVAADIALVPGILERFHLAPHAQGFLQESLSSGISEQQHCRPRLSHLSQAILYLLCISHGIIAIAFQVQVMKRCVWREKLKRPTAFLSNT